MTISKQNHKLGLVFENDRLVMLFGNKNCNFQNLQLEFPQLKLIRLKQTHSDQVVKINEETPDYTLSGDALWTASKNIGLLISTADCIPLMAFSESQNFIMNVHAGWRGIENQISIKAVNQIIENSIDVSQLKFFIGPHIKQENFEVDLDVRNKLYDSIPARMRTEQILAKTFEVKGAKHHIDLSLIMEQQLHSVGVNQSQISKSSIDTFTSTEFHSHRREREKAGRQLSLIYLK